MIDTDLRTGMVAHTKKIDVHVGNLVMSYSAPRGKKFAILLLGDETPTGEPDEGIQIDKWLEARGWKLEE